MRSSNPPYAARFNKWAYRRQLSALKDIQLAHILSGSTCDPISLPDLEAYMSFKAHCIENLQFVVWFQSYRKRFFELPEEVQGMSPGPGEGEWTFGAPSRVELDRRNSVGGSVGGGSGSGYVSESGKAKGRGRARVAGNLNLISPTISSSIPQSATTSFSTPGSHSIDDHTQSQSQSQPSTPHFEYDNNPLSLISPTNSHSQHVGGLQTPLTPNFSRPLIPQSPISPTSDDGSQGTVTRKLHKHKRPLSVGGASFSTNGWDAASSIFSGPGQGHGTTSFGSTTATSLDLPPVPKSPLTPVSPSQKTRDPINGKLQKSRPLQPLPSPGGEKDRDILTSLPQNTGYTALQPLRTEALNIVATFLKPGASKELTLDAYTRDTVLKALVWNTHPNVFLPAYEAIYDSIERETIPHFLVFASANINLPKQIFWYTSGTILTSISILIAVIAMVYGQHYGDGHGGLEKKGGGRAWRLWVLFPATLGCMHLYAAGRGFCSQVWGRGATQLRVWELADIADTSEPRVHSSRRSMDGHSIGGEGEDAKVNAKEYWMDVERKEVERVQEIKDSIAVGVGQEEEGGGKKEVGKKEEEMEKMRRTLMLKPKAEQMLGLPVSVMSPSTAAVPSPSRLEEGGKTKTGSKKSGRARIAPFSSSEDEEVDEGYDSFGYTSGTAGNGNGYTTSGTNGEDERDDRRLLKPKSRSKSNKSSPTSSSGTIEEEKPYTYPTPHSAPFSLGKIQTLATPKSYRRPPIFGPERVVKDPRIIALHKKIIDDILVVGFVYGIGFTCVVLALPGIPRG